MSKWENIQPLKTILEAIVPDQYEIKVLRADEIKIPPKNIECYCLVKKALEEKNTDFHTFRPKQERRYNVGLKGIHSSIALDEIREEIESLVHKISNISNIKHRVSKQSLSMFYINLK